MRPIRAIILLAATLGLAIAPLDAQAPAKKVLTQADYDIWRSIQGATLSPDGQWVVYTLQPLVGEGELVVRSTKTGQEFRHTRGYTGRPPGPGIPAGGGPGGPGAGGGRGGSSTVRFTADSKHVLFIVEPSKADVERVERESAARRGRGGRGRAGNDELRNSLAIMSLPDGKVTIVPNVRSFNTPSENGRFVAYMLASTNDSTGAAQDSTAARQNVAANAPGGQARPAGDSTARAARRKTYGSTMVLRDLSNGAETRVDDVVAFEFNAQGTWLAYTVSSRDTARDGVYLHSPRDGKVTAVMTGLGNYRQLTFDDAGEQIAFVSDRDEYNSEKPRFTLYYAQAKAGKATPIVTSDAIGNGNTVADRGTLEFTEDGSAIFFPLAPPALDSIPADSLADKAIYDLWHWRDPRLQSQQRLSANRDRNRTFTAVYHIGAKRFLQLTNDTITSVDLSDDGRVGVASSPLPYMVEAMWGEGGSDIFVVNTLTGARKQIRTKARGNTSLSPAAKYVTWFEKGAWYAYNIANGRTVEMTRGLPVRFEQETHDTPSEPPAWGIGGWTPDDNSVLVYDRYDVWELDPDGERPARNITESVGRNTRMIFRVVNLDRDDGPLDPSRPLLLRAMDDETKASGFWQDRINGNTPPTRIMMVDRRVGTPQKARDAEQYLLTQETFTEFPDLWTGSSLAQLEKISNANPQQKDYRWGTVEMVSWLNMDGVPVRGLLYKPEDFDPSKKYPMVVYFYEQHTDGLHGYIVPTGRNVINAPVYVSKGYLVFMPDIYYTDGYPGPSALKTIVPGVQMLIAKGFVKEDGIGIQGQSWGGYQTTYIITQTSLVKAAMAGAPVANMTSAYGGIRWESGNSRTVQYEHGQSRIGGSPWEYPERYIENSPLFFADRVKTPLFIMHNDEDGAVPWYQGIEMYIALRRLGKEVYLINYNGDAHNPRKRANQRDMDIKMQQFFDHHLTGAPMPDWMKNGIPYLHKGRDQLGRTATKPVSN